jgi:glycosyltransferase involved in cell wall biosynthesis
VTIPSLTAIVLTLDEERHLPACLSSLRQVTDDIIVLDSGSRDRTVEIAEAAGACVRTRPFTGYASQRNAALELAPTAEWVLFLDADERLTAAGASELHARLAGETAVAAFWFPRRNLFWGRELRGGGWWPDEQARLFRWGCVRYDETREVHEVAVIEGPSAWLREPLVHLNYDSRREFIGKQRAYTRWRVREALESGAVPRRRAYLSAPARELHRRLVVNRGYRDGMTGLFLAAILAVEELRAVWLVRRRSEP